VQIPHSLPEVFYEIAIFPDFAPSHNAPGSFRIEGSQRVGRTRDYYPRLGTRPFLDSEAPDGLLPVHGPPPSTEHGADAFTSGRWSGVSCRSPSQEPGGFQGRTL
jgi:hypothetical protein